MRGPSAVTATGARALDRDDQAGPQPHALAGAAVVGHVRILMQEWRARAVPGHRGDRVLDDCAAIVDLGAGFQLDMCPPSHIR
jgi:hypothetical protein